MVLFAALTFVSLVERGLALRGLRSSRRSAVMVVLALAIERAVLRPLVNRRRSSSSWRRWASASSSRALAQTVWGTEVHGLELGIADTPLCRSEGVMVSPSSICSPRRPPALLVLVLALLFQRTRFGLALRAVADDPLAALAVGIELRRIWAIVWAVAGGVALVAGLLWGRASGRAVLSVAGRAQGVAGADHRRLHVDRRRDRGRPDRGCRRRSSPRSTSGPLVGGGIENWFPYVLAMLFLLARPTGLFGEKRRGEGVT